MAKKLFYKIGEACKRLDIQPYVLRYWETEFPLLAPNKSTSGQRVYSEQDLRVIQRIKELLYEEGYTIAGAKKKLEKQDLAGLAAVRDPARPGSGNDDAGEGIEDAEVGAEGDDEPQAKAEAEENSETVAVPKRKKRKKKAAGAAGSASAATEARLRRGIRDALEEARAILDLLDG